MWQKTSNAKLQFNSLSITWKNKLLTNLVVNKLIVEDRITNRLSPTTSKISVFGMGVGKRYQFNYKRPIFSIVGKFQEDDSLFFRILFSVNNYPNSQTMHTKGIPDQLSIRENVGSHADCRAFLIKFTSTFKESLVYEKFTMHCTRIGSLQKSEKRTKRKKGCRKSFNSQVEL